MTPSDVLIGFSAGRKLSAAPSKPFDVCEITNTPNPVTLNSDTHPEEPQDP